MLHPGPDWSEQDPIAVRESALQCLNKVCYDCRSTGKLQGIAISAAMHSLIPVDSQGLPLSNMLIWADNRAATIAEDLRQTEKGRALFQLTGTPVHAMSPLVKLRWIREHQPEIWKKTACFHDIKSFIWTFLFRKNQTDYSLASASGMMNLINKQWESAALDWLQLSDTKLPALVSTGEILAYDSKINPALSIPHGTPIVIGASDGCLANLGAGALEPGVLAVTIGTSGAIRMGIPDPKVDPLMRIFCYYLKEHQYITGGGTNSGAVVLHWLKEQIFRDRQPMENFLNEAASVPPGSEGLLFLPYLLGERAPFWNAHLRGGFEGLSIEHQRPHMIRAAMEGVVYHLRLLGDILAEQGPLKKIIAGGGFAQNRLWVQILADVFQLPVEAPEMVEGSALGAVMLGREALGLEAMEMEGKGEVYLPDAGVSEVYRRQMVAFRRKAKES
jgi:gluconokinase